MKKIQGKSNPSTIDHIFAQEAIQKTFESFYEHGTNALINMNEIKRIIPLSSYKKQLDTVRKTNNKTQIAATEKTIIASIIKSIQNSGLNRDIVDRTYLETSIPTSIIQSQDISCV
jgi:hypothetical protein